MAFDPNSPLQSHVGLSDIAQIKENFNQLRKCEASATEPGNLVAGVFWYDTTTDILKLRNEANTAWQNIWDFANAKVGVDGVQSTSIKAGTTAVVVSANDTTKGYLNGKLVAGTGITLTENGDGGAETLTVAALIPTTGLKTSQTTIQVASQVSDVPVENYGNITLPGGEYGFFPQLKASHTSPPITGYAKIAHGYGLSTSAITLIAMGAYHPSGYGAGPFYMQAVQRYVTASGKEHWAFFLTKDGQIQLACEAPDHPSYGNGDDPNEISHPFADYWNKPLPEGYEIVQLDIASINEVKKQATKKRGILEIIQDDYEIDFTSKPKWKPRDIDGHSIMQKPHPSWVLRSLKKKVK